jgi:hypothetical protein
VNALDDIDQPNDLTELIAADILTALGDKHSKAFYRLVARKVPEGVIRRALSELKEGSAEFPAKVFTSKMLDYAQESFASAQGTEIARKRQVLSDRLRWRGGRADIGKEI